MNLKQLLAAIAELDGVMAECDDYMSKQDRRFIHDSVRAAWIGMRNMARTETLDAIYAKVCAENNDGE